MGATERPFGSGSDCTMDDCDLPPDRRVGARLSDDLRTSTAVANPGYDGQPAVYLYIAALEVNVLNCRAESVRSVFTSVG
jgi:hypothetical protein